MFIKFSLSYVTIPTNDPPTDKNRAPNFRTTPSHALHIYSERVDGCGTEGGWMAFRRKEGKNTTRNRQPGIRNETSLSSELFSGWQRRRRMVRCVLGELFFNHRLSNGFLSCRLSLKRVRNKHRYEDRVYAYQLCGEKRSNEVKWTF